MYSNVKNLCRNNLWKFRSEWKKVNVIPTLKQQQKQQQQQQQQKVRAEELLPHFFTACFRKNNW